ncbi:MAG: hypothetical protein ACI8ZM_002942 [Crocinitomix sp.]|jgi:hypothetical protein
MRLFILFISICTSVVVGYGQNKLPSNELVLMKFSLEHAHIDSQAVQAFTLNSTEINTVDSLIFSIVDFYNVQVSRGALTIAEKHELDSLSKLQGDFRLVHRRKAKYKKRKMERFTLERQTQIKNFGDNRDSVYQVMMRLYTKSMPDRSHKVVQFGPMDRDTVDILNYKRQYMPYLNQNGERMVFANCSRDYGGDPAMSPELKAELENEFMWCGDCYEGMIMMRINLDIKKIVQFHTN